MCLRVILSFDKSIFNKKISNKLFYPSHKYFYKNFIDIQNFPLAKENHDLGTFSPLYFCLYTIVYNEPFKDLIFII